MSVGGEQVSKAIVSSKALAWKSVSPSCFLWSIFGARPLMLMVTRHKEVHIDPLSLIGARRVRLGDE